MILSFEIDRATWLHGETSRESYLERPSDGKRCCLGFLSLACGVPEEHIAGKKIIGTLPLSATSLLPYALFQNLYVTSKLMLLNDILLHAGRPDLLRHNIDNPLSSDEEREQLLTETFREVGIEVTFTGSYT